MSTHPATVALRRTRRSIRTALYATVSVGLLCLVVAFEAASSRLEWLPTAALLVGLLLILAGGVPLAIVTLADWMKTTTALHAARPGLEAWARARGLRHQTQVGKDDDPKSARIAVRGIKRLDEEIGADTLLPHNFANRHVQDLVVGDDPTGPVAFTIKGMRAPELLRRYVAVPHDFDLRGVSIVDARLDELWKGKGHRVESVHFDDRWRIRSKYPRRAHELVNPRAIAAFVDAPAALERVDVVPEWIVGWIAPETSAGDLERALHVLERLRDLVPRYLQG